MHSNILPTHPLIHDGDSGQEQGRKANLLSLPTEIHHQILELLVNAPDVLSLNKLPPRFDLVEAIGPLSCTCRGLRAGTLPWYARAKARQNLTKTTKFGHIDLQTTMSALLIYDNWYHSPSTETGSLVWYSEGSRCVVGGCPCQIVDKL